jgi:hypothetical protein
MPKPRPLKLLPKPRMATKWLITSCASRVKKLLRITSKPLNLQAKKPSLRQKRLLVQTLAHSSIRHLLRPLPQQ